MKKIRFIIVILLMFILCGCSGNYNLYFNEDLTIKEELNVEIERSNDAYEKTLSIFENANIDSDKYEVTAEGSIVKIKYIETYDTFEKYILNSNLYHVLFDDIQFSKDNIGITAEAESNIKLDGSKSNNIVNSYDIDDLNINIKVPFQMNKSNEDYKTDDIYTWNLKKSDTYKKISLDFSYNKASVLSIILLIVLIGIVSVFTIIILRNIIRKNKI